MQKLLSGVYKFKTEVYPGRKDLFADLSDHQSPRILFITCADSRIDPSLVTQAPPGDLFICRNAGNIVPPHQKASGGMAASIEFAVSALKVAHVVVCGHTDCGAVKGAMHPENLAELPHVSDWLAHTQAATAAVRARHGGMSDDCLAELTEENVKLQLTHLMTHPVIAAAVATNSLSLHGWMYDIGRGDIRIFDQQTQVWRSIEDIYKP